MALFILIISCSEIPQKSNEPVSLPLHDLTFSKISINTGDKNDSELLSLALESEILKNGGTCVGSSDYDSDYETNIVGEAHFVLTPKQIPFYLSFRVSVENNHPKLVSVDEIMIRNYSELQNMTKTQLAKRMATMIVKDFITEYGLSQPTPTPTKTNLPAEATPRPTETHTLTH